MPSYTVQADVVDITRDRPGPGDGMWVDTNVWYWQTYSRASQRSRPPTHWQVRDYPSYLQKCLVAGAKLHAFGLTLSELAAQIEHGEHEIAMSAGSVPAGTSLKDFRHNHSVLRAGVVQEIENAWTAVESIANIVPLSVDLGVVHQALQSFRSSALDAYDQFALQAISAHGISQVLSDDGDFCTVPGITLFTANRTVISSANAQGRLTVR